MNYFKNLNLKIKGIASSPIKGPEGNIEYLIYCCKNKENDIENFDNIIDDIVREAHNELNGRKHEEHRNRCK